MDLSGHKRFESPLRPGDFSPGTFRNRLVPVASGQGIPEAVTFHTEATIYRSELDSGVTVEHKSCALRRVLVYLTEGEIDINGKKIKEKEQARIDEVDDILIKAHRESGFFLIDVPSCKGCGHTTETLGGGKK